MTPEEIEELFRSPSAQTLASVGRTPTSVRDGSSDDDDQPPTRLKPETPDRQDGIIVDDTKSWRVERLKAVLLAVKEAYSDKNLKLDLMVEKLGNGSRDETWRIPIGESGLLDFFLNLLPTSQLSQPLKIHSLRLVGNSCADTDANRSRVVKSDHLRDIINLLDDDSVLNFVIPVLHNICVDYDPAQSQASKARLSSRLLNVIELGRLSQCQPLLHIICKILCLLITQDSEIECADKRTPIILLKLATKQTVSQLDNFCSLTNAALSYLTHEPLQIFFLDANEFETLQNVFAMSYTHFDLTSADEEDVADLKQIWRLFVQVIADISALPVFLGQNKLDGPVVKSLLEWLSVVPNSFTHLKTAACLALGNLSRSDQSSIALLPHVHQALCDIVLAATQKPPSSAPSESEAPNSKLQTSPLPPSQLLHAALSFFKNLAIPASSKPQLGPTLLDPRLWTITSTHPQTQLAAISLARLLLVGCPENARLMCAPPTASPQSSIPACTKLQHMIDLFRKLDTPPCKTEAARAVVTTCRLLYSCPESLPDQTWQYPSSRDSDSNDNNPNKCNDSTTSTPIATNHNPATDPLIQSRAALFAAHPTITYPLTFLVVQSKFPALRSEAMFILALMSRAPDGAGAAVAAGAVVKPFEACRVLVEALTGRRPVSCDHLAQLAAETGVDPDVEFAAGMDKMKHDSAPANETPGSDAPAREDVETLQLPATGLHRQNNATVEDMLGGLDLEPRQVDPAQAAGMAKVDRENGLVLIMHILKNSPGSLSQFQRVLLEKLLKSGGKLVLDDWVGEST